MTSSAPDALHEAITASITDAINRLGRQGGCRPLHWRVERSPEHGLELTGQAGGGDYDEHEAITVIGQWARYWNLEPVERPVVTGTAEYHGRVERFLVTVWAVTDRATFEAAGSRQSTSKNSPASPCSWT